LFDTRRLTNSQGQRRKVHKEDIWRSQLRTDLRVATSSAFVGHPAIRTHSCERPMRGVGDGISLRIGGSVPTPVSHLNLRVDGIRRSISQKHFSSILGGNPPAILQSLLRDVGYVWGKHAVVETE
jgi:hypothetical protein